MYFSSVLSEWYLEHKRTLPWRGEKNPYKIWISEVILQQTRVKQGWDYYLRFIETFPTVKALAAAPQEKVLKVWQGLGYYSRARNLHEAAKQIVEKYHGVFPKNYEDIRQLKGVGDYTAAAIASLAFGLPYPAIDGNLLRVICRIFGIFDDIMLSATKKIVTEKCLTLMKEMSPGEFNEAMMDFGSLQCVPQNPDCEICPFQNQCYAFIHHVTDTLPIKTKRISLKERHLHYVFYRLPLGTIIKKRTENDIWKGLYELPMIESENKESEALQDLLHHCNHGVTPDYYKRHLLTHQRLYLYFYTLTLKDMPVLSQGEQFVLYAQLSQYPFSKVVAEFLKQMALLV
jgi:A/G-specific adenine glycosylase